MGDGTKIQSAARPVDAIQTPPRPPGAPPLDASFQVELTAFLQRRLRLVTGILAVSASVLLVVSRILDIAQHGWVLANQTHPAVLTHAAACLIALFLYLFLRRRPRSATTLVWMDGIVAEALILASLLVLTFSYEYGMRQQAAQLGLLLVARAIVVPSRARRTLLLSAPAPLGVLLIQLLHGRAYTFDGALFPEAGFASHVVWTQVILWFSVVLATVTSYVSFGLRMKAFEAARVDRYTLEERLGGGAMGEVFRARHALMKRPAAVKILRPEIAGPDTFARFEREVQLTSQLTHPNTVSIFDYGQTADGLFYYAMELLEGADLDHLVKTTGPLSPARVIHILVQVCNSLQEAHAHGLVHRDVKPANIILCQRGGESDVVKVMDFGLVKSMHGGAALSAPDALSGTPLTMAPEMIRGQAVGPPADLYALGVVGCFLLTGKPIFDLATPAEMLVGHLSQAPIPPSACRPDVPADLESCLLRCLEKSAAERPQTAAAVRGELLACADAGGWSSDEARSWWGAHAQALSGSGAGASPSAPTQVAGSP